MCGWYRRVLVSVARTGVAADRAVPARPGGGADRARAGAERFTGTKRAAGPKLTAGAAWRSNAARVVIPGMSAWADEAAGSAEGSEPAGDGVATRGARRFFAGVGCGLRAAARRGLAGGWAAGVPADFLLAAAFACGGRVTPGCGLPVALGSGAGVRAGGGLAVAVGCGRVVRVGAGLAVWVGAGVAVWVGAGLAVRVGAGEAVWVGSGLVVWVGCGVATGGLADPRGWAGGVTVPDTPGIAALPGCVAAGRWWRGCASETL
jgi:hypothetical protein